MKNLVVILTMLVGTGLGLPAWAASLTSIEGGVQVNRGGGYRKATGNVDVGAGDQVMIEAGGRATLVFGNGCQVPVNPGSVYVVPAEAPCAAEPTTETAQSDFGLTPEQLALGGAAVGVGAVVAVVASSNSSSSSSPGSTLVNNGGNPASP